MANQLHSFEFSLHGSISTNAASPEQARAQALETLEELQPIETEPASFQIAQAFLAPANTFEQLLRKALSDLNLYIEDEQSDLTPVNNAQGYIEEALLMLAASRAPDPIATE